MKVYGWYWTSGAEHGRAIMAARSKARLRELVPSLGYAFMRDHVTDTANEDELRVALAEPEVMFFRPDRDRASGFRRESL